MPGDWTIMTINEIREHFDLPPLKDGDRHLTTLGPAPIGSILDQITALQNSVKQIFEPVQVVMGEEIYNSLKKEAESCSMVQFSGTKSYVPELHFINDLEIKVSNSVGSNQVLFCGRDGNFSKFALIKNVGTVNDVQAKPKRKGRYIRCNLNSF